MLTTLPSDPVAEQLPLLAEYTAASIQGLVASGPRAGHRVRRRGLMLATLLAQVQMRVVGPLPLGHVRQHRDGRGQARPSSGES
jgi:hypothetical protein